MDGATSAGWVVALATVGILWYTIRAHKQTVKTYEQEMARKKMDADRERLEETRRVTNEALRPIIDNQRRHDKYHAEHYTGVADISHKMASLDQEMEDHKERDDERFGRIEGMYADTQKDIKEILRRLPRVE